MNSEQIEFSLSSKDIKGIPFQRYQKDFNFVVDGKHYSTSRIVADILSPIIRKFHYTDETIQEYHITTNKQNEPESEDYFTKFINLVTFDKVQINSIEREYFIQYFYQLGNIDGYFKLQPEYFNTLTPENVIDRLLNLQRETKIENIGEFSLSEHVDKIIEFISSNFDEIEYEKLKKIPIFLLEKILKSSSFKISDEDKLLDIVLRLYEENNKYSVLFENILFKNVSETKLKEFIENFNVEDINQQIWIAFNILHIKGNENNEYESIEKNRYKHHFIEFKYSKGKEFEGIMRNLTKETGGNIHDNGTIEISTNNLNTSNPPKNVVDYENDNCFDPQDDNKQGSYVCFDFKSKKVQLSCYSIKSYTQRYLKNWSIEVSNDGDKWIEIDRHENESILNESNKIATFQISKEQKEFYRFVRLVETGTCWGGDRYDGDFTMIEFFGKLIKPE